MASHGRKAVFKLANAAGTLTDITANLTKVEPENNVDTAEITTMGLNSKKFISGLREGKNSIEGVYDGTIATMFGALLGVDDRSWEFFPEGTTAGKPKESGLCLLTSFKRSSDLGDANKFTAELQVSGDVTFGVAP